MLLRPAPAHRCMCVCVSPTVLIRLYRFNLPQIFVFILINFYIENESEREKTKFSKNHTIAIARYDWNILMNAFLNELILLSIITLAGHFKWSMRLFALVRFTHKMYPMAWNSIWKVMKHFIVSSVDYDQIQSSFQMVLFLWFACSFFLINFLNSLHLQHSHDKDRSYYVCWTFAIHVVGLHFFPIRNRRVNYIWFYWLCVCV